MLLSHIVVFREVLKIISIYIKYRKENVHNSNNINEIYIT